MNSSTSINEKIISKDIYTIGGDALILLNGSNISLSHSLAGDRLMLRPKKSLPPEDTGPEKEYASTIIKANRDMIMISATGLINGR